MKKGQGVKLSHIPGPATPWSCASQARIGICLHFVDHEAKTKVPGAARNRPQVNAILHDSKGPVVLRRDTKPHSSQSTSETTQRLTGCFISVLDSLRLSSLGFLVALDWRGCRQVPCRHLARAVPPRLQRAVKPQVSCIADLHQLPLL